MKTRASLAVALCLAGCDENDCMTAPASMQLHISVPNASSVRSLAVEVTMNERRGRKIFDVSDQLADGTTSLEVILDGAPNDQFIVTLWIAAYTDPDAGGLVLSRANGDFIADPNGCNRVELALAPVRPIEQPDGGETVEGDAGVTDMPDDAEPANDDAGEPPPPPPPLDADVPDQPDGSIASDGGDAGPTNCPSPDPNTLALYTFDNDVNTATITDATGAHNGRIVAGTANTVSGPEGCGDAVVFPAGGNVQEYGFVADSQDWDLAEGSIDLWLLLRDRPPRMERMGVLSRDADGNGRGRFSIRTACDGTIVVKLEAGSEPYYQCSNAPVPRDAWSRVTVNFGAPGFELLIDGSVQTRTGAVGLLGIDCLQTVTCGTSTTAGIAGNAFPWIIGADSNEVNNNQFSGLDAPFDNSAIDHLSISNIRRP